MSLLEQSQWPPSRSPSGRPATRSRHDCRRALRVLSVRAGVAQFEDVGRQLPANIIVRRYRVGPGTGISDDTAADNHSCGNLRIEPQFDALIVARWPGHAPGGDAEPPARDIEAQ